MDCKVTLFLFDPDEIMNWYLKLELKSTAFVT